MNVLFVCVGNSGRSVMAERLFAHAAEGRHEARSRGAHPQTDEAEPVVVEALAELGIDATDHVPRKLDEMDYVWADVIVQVCDVGCPVVPGARQESWGISDPWGLPLEEVRPIRDQISGKVDELVATL